MELRIINHKSKWLGAVQNLGDASSGTVGFLAREVYSDYARKGHILVATDGKQLLAYTMFRWDTGNPCVLLFGSYRKGYSKRIV